MANSFEPYGKIWILPVTYMIVFIIFWRFKNGKKLFSSMGDILFKIAVTIRYLIIPAVIIKNGSAHYGFGSYVGIEKYDYAILYMAYELLIVSIVYLLLEKRKKITISLESKITQKNSISLYKILISVGIVLLLIPEVRSRYTFFASSIVMTSREIVSSYDGRFNLIFYLSNYAKIAFPIVVLVYFNKKYSIDSKTRYVVMAIIGTMMPNLFYIATSRNSIFLPMLASFFTMLAIFDKHKKIIYTIYGTGIVSIIGIMTALKSLGGSTNVTNDWLVNYLSIYFLGPKEYAVGLTSIEIYNGNATIYTFINDIIGNIPVLSSFADLLDRTSQYYNWAYYGGSHIGIGGGYIIPSSIQGAFHFGYIFGPLMVIIALFTIRWSEYLAEKNSANISTVYIANYSMSAAAIFYANSISSLLNLMFFIILPLLVINIVQRLLIQK
jgi:hypothetical protein